MAVVLAWDNVCLHFVLKAWVERPLSKRFVELNAR